MVGVQFQWYFRYPGADATFGSTRPQLVNAAAGNPLGIDPANTDGNDDVVAANSSSLRVARSIFGFALTTSSRIFLFPACDSNKTLFPD